MTTPAAPVTTEASAAPAPAAAASASSNEAAALAMLGFSEPEAPKPEKAPPEPAKAAPEADAKADDDDGDPLDDKHYSEEALNTPEKRAAARARLFKHLNAVKEMTRKAHRAHGAAEVRERKVLKREADVVGREQRVELVERAQAKAIEDMSSGDTQRFLTGFAALSKAGDPAGFWRDVSLSLLKNEPVSAKRQAQAEADPELARRLEALEQGIASQRAREEDAFIERSKAHHLQVAQQSAEKFPHLAAFAREFPDRARDGIMAVLVEECQRIGRPVDISTAYGIIERELSARYELSPRADGKTNGEKGTTGSAPDAGRETSKEPPKPETAIAPATVPAALASTPGSANRPETPEEERARQIRELDAMGFFS